MSTEKISMFNSELNIDYFIEKYESKLVDCRKYYAKLKEHFGLVEIPDEKRIKFKSEEMIYIGIINSLKIIKNKE